MTILGIVASATWWGVSFKCDLLYVVRKIVSTVVSELLLPLDSLVEIDFRDVTNPNFVPPCFGTSVVMKRSFQQMIMAALSYYLLRLLLMLPATNAVRSQQRSTHIYAQNRYRYSCRDF